MRQMRRPTCPNPVAEITRACITKNKISLNLIIQLKFDNIEDRDGGANLKILESAENYLETILMLKQRNGYVRSIDIANELNFSKPSVSNAMKSFRENELITMDTSGLIELTPKGAQIAKDVYEKHILLGQFLMLLGVSEEVAKADACRIEHVISDETFDRIKEHMKALKGAN